MRYDVNRENIDANVLEAEEVIRAMNAEKGMVFVFQTHAGKERAFRCALSGDPDRDCEDAARKIKEDGAERFIAIALRLPEDLEYAGLFEDIFDRYTSGAKLVRVKTTNLGSLNRLSYELRLLRPGTEKAMIDELRCRNGNLEINLAAHSENGDL